MHNPSEWPKAFVTDESVPLTVSDEMKSNKVLANAVSTVSSQDIFDFTRYSNLTKAVRVFCFVQRAIRKFKELVGLGISSDSCSSELLISNTEFEEAKATLIQREQRNYFENEITALETTAG